MEEKKPKAKNNRADSESEAEDSDINDEDFYEIEEIRHYRTTATGYEFLVKWKDWDNRYNSWEPVKSFIFSASAEAMLTNFCVKNLSRLETRNLRAAAGKKKVKG